MCDSVRMSEPHTLRQFVTVQTVDCSFNPMNADPVLCRCLAVTQSQVIDCIAVTGAENVRQITECTGAGRGCLSCHRQIRDLIQQRTEQHVHAPLRDSLR